MLSRPAHTQYRHKHIDIQHIEKEGVQTHRAITLLQRSRSPLCSGSRVCRSSGGRPSSSGTPERPNLLCFQVELLLWRTIWDQILMSQYTYTQTHTETMWSRFQVAVLDSSVISEDLTWRSSWRHFTSPSVWLHLRCTAFMCRSRSDWTPQFCLLSLPETKLHLRSQTSGPDWCHWSRTRMKGGVRGENLDQLQTFVTSGEVWLSFGPVPGRRPYICPLSMLTDEVTIVMDWVYWLSINDHFLLLFSHLCLSPVGSPAGNSVGVRRQPTWGKPRRADCSS